MAEKLVVGPINKGLRGGVTPFNVDNDSFPTLVNAYQWRGRIKRKRGTTLLCRLQRYFNSDGLSYTGGVSVTIILDGSGNGNILTGFGLEANGNIVPGTVSIVDTTSLITYTDPTKDGFLTPTGTGGPNTINYATGDIVIPAAAGHAITVAFVYNPDLPVMGLEDLNLNPNQVPGTMAFDTVYSYIIQQLFPYASYDVSFYKNPPTGFYPGYVQKTFWTPTTWNGQDYQQFWTVNYQGALWVTNGVKVPFNITNIGMQFKPITGMNITLATAPEGPSIVTLTIASHGLVVGDFVFINEVIYTAPNIANSINFQTGYVIAVIDGNNVSVEFPNAFLTGTYSNGGIAQYLTNRADTTVDSLRWFDGDPTNGSTTAPVLLPGTGWVNFAPPLSREVFSIAGLPPAQYYLVGAKMIIPFRDRLLFFGAVVQTSSAGSQVYLRDTVVYSLDGTPYYTASFTGDPSLATTVFHEILVPVNETAVPGAYWSDQTGFGGWLQAGVADTITTASFNEDVIIVGFTQFQSRLVFSGDDITPFNFYIINSELGSSSTFSAINMDKAILTKGNRGYIETMQVGADRIDLEVPDQVFQVKLTENGNERVTAQRDFLNEWIYFTYPSNEVTYKFPNQTLQFNYRDNSYALLNESYTTYGQFRKGSGLTWATVGASLPLPMWSSWNSPWNSGTSTVLQPNVIGGNQQGFVMVRDDEALSATQEGTSLYIQSITGNTVTSPQHNLNNNDYIVITGALGTVSTQVNGLIFQVYGATTNTFNLNPSIVAGTYFGGGLITRMYVPFVQTRQFPVSWGMGRKVKLGSQLYLITKTPNGQITVQIYLSQNDQSPYNAGTIVPAVSSVNDSLIYSAVVFTSPEKFINNVTTVPIGNIGDGVSLTYNLNFITQFSLDGTIIPGSVQIIISNVASFLDTGLGTFNVTGTGVSAGSSINYLTGSIVLVFSAAPLNQPSIANFQYYTINIISPSQSSQSQIWHRMNTSLIGDTVQLGFTLSDDQMRDPTFSNQFEEIEIHGFVVDVSPSQVLA